MVVGPLTTRLGNELRECGLIVRPEFEQNPSFATITNIVDVQSYKFVVEVNFLDCVNLVTGNCHHNMQKLILISSLHEDDIRADPSPTVDKFVSANRLADGNSLICAK